MTLLVAMVNADQAVMLADRRLSAGGAVSSEEGNKLAVLTCRNARAAVAFTGLAECGRFHTHEWILEGLLEAAPPDYLFGPLLERFQQRATERFRSLPATAAAK